MNAPPFFDCEKALFTGNFATLRIDRRLGARGDHGEQSLSENPHRGRQIRQLD